MDYVGELLHCSAKDNELGMGTQRATIICTQISEKGKIEKRGGGIPETNALIIHATASLLVDACRIRVRVEHKGLRLCKKRGEPPGSRGRGLE